MVAATPRYEYGVEYLPDLAINSNYVKEIKLGPNGDQDEWIKTYDNMNGNMVKVEYPDGSLQSFHYNNKNQLIKSVDFGSVTTLYAYNNKGEREIVAVDMDQNGVIDFNGTDRITKTMQNVMTAHGTNVFQTQTLIWDTYNLDVSRVSNISERSVDGLQAWGTRFGQTTHSKTDYLGNGDKTVTVMRPDGAMFITNYLNGRLESTTVLDALSNQRTQSSFIYDEHGRQSGLNDARNGLRTTVYNDADLPISITTTDPGINGDPQTEIYQYDSRLRRLSETQPDGGIVNYEYIATGELQSVSGSRTYPIQYTYEKGRLKTMATWKDFEFDQGAAITTWDYDPQRGFMTTKTYADGNKVNYTYTDGGKLATRTWARGITTTYSYNNGGDFILTDYSDNTPDISISYNRLGLSN